MLTVERGRIDDIGQAKGDRNVAGQVRFEARAVPIVYGRARHETAT
ncbi:MAG TPA: hypothetical protein VKG22_03150 [Stellaceae bacterium]|nr:hypothetical protein [Stellaceae bacterium]HMD65632.1 hypothetical protein [Stellaceae bacterium]